MVKFNKKSVCALIMSFLLIISLLAGCAPQLPNGVAITYGGEFITTGNSTVFTIENLNKSEYSIRQNLSESQSDAAQLNASKKSVALGSIKLKNNQASDEYIKINFAGEESDESIFSELLYALYIDGRLENNFFNVPVLGLIEGRYITFKLASGIEADVNIFVWMPQSSIKNIASQTVGIKTEIQTASTSFPLAEEPVEQSFLEIVDAHEENALLSLTFDESSGNNISDSSPKNIQDATFTMNNPTAYRPSEVAPFRNSRSSVNGSSLSFDGVHNSISYPNNQVKISGNKLTVDAFVAPRSFVWSDTNKPKDQWLTHTICGQYTGTSSSGVAGAVTAGFMVGYTKYGYWMMGVYIEGKGWKTLYNSNAVATSKLDLYEWNHITCVFDGEAGVMKLYKNGIEVASSTSNTLKGEIRPSNNPFIVGKGNVVVHNGVSEYDMSHFSGLIDEFKLYNVAKSSIEVMRYHKLFLRGSSYSIRKLLYEDARLQEQFTADDYYRPQYHAVPSGHWMNEPHALFKYNNMWHLFYQHNSYGPFWQGGMVWGHFASRDMINWVHVKDMGIPMENSVINDGAWSGNMAFNAKGEPILFITAGNDKRIDVDGSPLGSNQNIVIATPKDTSDIYLTEWEIADSLSIAQKDLKNNERGIMNEFRDPQIFEEDGVYYMVICGRTSDSKPLMHLYTTTNGNFYTGSGQNKDYKVWTYRGNILPQTFYDNWETKFGQSAELPNLSPIYSADKTTKKYILAFAPSPNSNNIDIGSYYWIGSFDKTNYTFTPDVMGAPKLIDYCYKAFSGGTIYFDAESKKTYLAGLIQDDRNTSAYKDSGWAHASAMVRELYLKSDNSLGIKSAANFDGQIDTAKASINLTDATVAQVNSALAAVDGDMLRIKFKIKANSAAEFGFDLKKESETDRVRIIYKSDNNTIGIVKASYYTPNMTVNSNHKRDTSGALQLIDGYLEGEIYIDHAMVEGFFNESAAISSFVYNKGNAMSVFGTGITFEYFKLDYLLKGNTRAA